MIIDGFMINIVLMVCIFVVLMIWIWINVD